MSMAEYLTDLINTLTKINKQSWTIIQTVNNNNLDDLTKEEAGAYEQETLDKASAVMTGLTELFQRV